MLGEAIASRLSMLGREAGRLVLFSPCVVCGGELPWRDRFASCCGDCWRKLPRIACARCSRCAVRWEGGTAGTPFTCAECLAHRRPYDWIESWGSYDGGLDTVLQAFKFRRHDFLARPLAGLLVEAWAARGDFDFDAAVAVPMHSRRLRERGYNQADLLARHFCRDTGVPLQPSLLARRGEGLQQSTLPREERASNVRHLFEAGQAKGASILIIDDVCTTGETLGACARVLRRAGARRVAALVVARA